MKIEHEKIELVIYNNYDLLAVVIDLAKSLATAMKFEEVDIRKIELGVEEAVGNIIKYAFEEGEREKVKIVFSVESLGLGISVFEKGLPFDPDVIAEFSPEKFMQDLSDEGLGMYLLKQYMDEFSFINHGKEGKETRIFKYRHNRDLEQILNEEEKARAVAEREYEQLPRGSVKYTIRSLQPEEAVEVSRCAYTSYGYTYVHEAIYYPERVRAMNKSGDLISFVALNDENGDIMSHCALEREEDPFLPQVGVAATKPVYRGQGCLNGLNIALLNEARKRKFTGVFGRGISTHNYSQRSMLKHGLMPSALLVSSGKERKYKGIEQKKVQRESVVLQMIYMNEPQEHWVYPPAEHREMIRKIYGFIRGNPEIREIPQDLKPPEQASVIHLQTNMNSLVADIYIRSFGSDAVPEVARNLKKLCREEILSIYLHLPLADPLTAKLCREFEKLGFFFAGIMPASENRDRLILQYLNNYAIDYNYIATACDETQEILDYVRSQDPNEQETS
ncbi:MAG: ATP-binding protein [Bacteroidales bacterium]|nr:ATP-binding protein [Bacteroidales bacterium]MCF8386860.1 ATP-binding protein [Bacteroidales bacterium]MCF8396547.1 ATP-binding protein [Bacteroidales bacterium]